MKKAMDCDLCPRLLERLSEVVGIFLSKLCCDYMCCLCQSVLSMIISFSTFGH